MNWPTAIFGTVAVLCASIMAAGWLGPKWRAQEHQWRHSDLPATGPVEFAEPTAMLGIAALTEPEMRALKLTAELVNLVSSEVIGRGRTRTADLDEFSREIHRIQQMLLAQAAARAYPDSYRLLGRVVELDETREVR